MNLLTGENQISNGIYVKRVTVVEFNNYTPNLKEIRAFFAGMGREMKMDSGSSSVPLETYEVEINDDEYSRFISYFRF